MKFVDYYAILDVSPKATIGDIRQSYRRLALLNHPDVTGTSDSVIKMQMLNEAYSVLGNPVKRARYDFWRNYHKQSIDATDRDSVGVPGYSSTEYRPAENIQTPGKYEDPYNEILNFFSQLTYRLIISAVKLLINILIFLPTSILYYYLIGKLLYFLFPYSDVALPATLACTSILLIYTYRRILRTPVGKKLARLMF